MLRIWLPILVSLCAISVAAFQSSVTRRHARLSVQPRLEWTIIADSRLGTVEVALANVGLGPAIIRSLAFTIDGTPMPLSGMETCDAINATLGRSPDAFDTHCHMQTGEWVIRAGDQLALYRSEPAPGQPAELSEKEFTQYRRFGATGTYCSFYDECWEIETP